MGFNKWLISRISLKSIYDNKGLDYLIRYTLKTEIVITTDNFSKKYLKLLEKNNIELINSLFNE